MARENGNHFIFAFGSMDKDVFCKNDVCGTVNLFTWVIEDALKKASGIFWLEVFCYCMDDIRSMINYR